MDTEPQFVLNQCIKKSFSKNDENLKSDLAKFKISCEKHTMTRANNLYWSLKWNT